MLRHAAPLRSVWRPQDRADAQTASPSWARPSDLNALSNPQPHVLQELGVSPTLAGAAQRSAERRPKHGRAAAPPIAALRERGSRAAPGRILGTVSRVVGAAEDCCPRSVQRAVACKSRAGRRTSAALRWCPGAVPCKVSRRTA
jgi:hypothetical protein